MKSEPYLGRADAPLGGSFHWKRDQLIVRGGGLICVGCGVLLRFGTVNAIWLTSDDDGNELVNLDVWNPDGTVLFSLRDNDWVAIGPLEDIECPPSARSLILRAPSKGIRLALQFSELTEAGLRSHLQSESLQTFETMRRELEGAASRAEAAGAPTQFVEALRRQDEDAATFANSRTNELMDAVRRVSSATEFAFCEIDAHLVFPFDVRLTPTRLILPGNNVISGSTAFGGEVAVQIR